MPRTFTTVRPRRRAGIRRAASSQRAWRLVGALLVAGVMTLAVFCVPAHRRPPAGGALLQVESVPPGATIEIDGRGHGGTPATLSLAPGEHRVRLRRDEYLDAIYQISLAAGQTTAVRAELWLRTPKVQRLRPPFPGAIITNASFLRDGQVAVTITVPPGDERQLWLLDGRGGTRRLGPPTTRGSLAVAADGQQLAYLASSQGPSAVNGRLDEVWIARANDERGERRYALPIGANGERLLDLTWAPTGRHLLVVSRQQRPDGAYRSRLRLLDIAGGEPHELASLPSEVVPGSYTWSPGGHALAFIARTDQLLALCLVSAFDGAFHYLADLGRDSLNPSSFPPLAWSADGRRLVYAAPAHDRAISGSRPFGATSPLLFTADLTQPLGQALGEARGDAPARRGDGSIVALARSKRDGPLVLRAVEPGGNSRNLAALPLPRAATFAVRWDGPRPGDRRPARLGRARCERTGVLAGALPPGGGAMTSTRRPVPAIVAALTLSLSLLTPLPVAAQSPPTAPTPVATPMVPVTPTPTPTPAPAGNRAPEPSGGPLDFLPDLVPDLLPDPKEWAADVFNQVLVTLLRGIADALRGAVGGVLDSSLNFITRTPPEGSYQSPTVRSLWNVVRLIANAGLALVALWGGFNLIVREQIGSPYHEAMELFPRLVVGALLVNTSLAWGQLAIDANNALCQALGRTELPAWERADTPTQLLVDVIATVVYLVTGLLLLLQMLMRLALVDVLLVASPLGLLCWVLPQTQSWARLWSNTFFSAVFTQFVQVLALKLGGSLLTELTPTAADSALLSVFLGVAVLVLTLRIPGLMRAQTGDSLGFVRYIAYRQGARAIEGRASGSGGAGRARGGA